MKIVDIHAHVYPDIHGVHDGQFYASMKYGQVRLGNMPVQFLPPSFENSSSPVEVHRQYMKWLGINHAVLMANTMYGIHNDYLADCVKKYPGIYTGVAYADPFRGEDSVRELQYLHEHTHLFGFKVEVNSCFACHWDIHMTDPLIAPVYEYLNQAGQPVFTHPCRPYDIEDLMVLADRYKNIKFIICHMGAETTFGPSARKNMIDFMITETSKRDNVFLDTSTFPYYYDANEAYPFTQSVKIIEKAWQKVGTEKMMWSSDYPGMLVMATYKQLIDFVAVNCRSIPEDAREKIMGENAYNLFFK